jgi:hypothetical protein
MMNKQLEEQFKESLQGFEMPYDAGAWAALSSELEKRQSSPNSNTGRNWLIGGSTFLLTTLVVCAIWLSKDNQSSGEQNRTAPQNKVQAQVNEVTTNSSDKVENFIEKKHTNLSQNQQTAVVNDQSTNLPVATNLINERINVSQGISGSNQAQETRNDNSGSNTATINEKAIEKPTKESGTASNDVGSEDKQNSPFVVETLTSICIGNTQKCHNPNSCEMLVVKPSGEQLTIPKGRNMELLVDQEGIFQVGRIMNGTFKAEASFVGLPNPKAEMQFKDEEIYESGLPVVKLSTLSDAVNATWTIGKKRAQLSGKEVNAHFYYKGNEDVTLTIVHENGCASSEKRSINIAKDYNLLAVTAFDPLSADIRKNTFMPFALTQRTVDFTMIVIDPTDGAVIFETDDATLPWKGTDKRNGQLVEPNKAYIWRVVLSNPEEGEPEEYKGTIVRM